MNKSTVKIIKGKVTAYIPKGDVYATLGNEYTVQQFGDAIQLTRVERTGEGDKHARVVRTGRFPLCGIRFPRKIAATLGLHKNEHLFFYSWCGGVMLSRSAIPALLQDVCRFYEYKLLFLDGKIICSGGREDGCASFPTPEAALGAHLDLMEQTNKVEALNDRERIWSNSELGMARRALRMSGGSANLQKAG